MRRNFTVLLIVLFSFVSIVLAKERQIIKKAKQAPVTDKAVLIAPDEVAEPAVYAMDENAVTTAAPNVQSIRKTAAAHHVLIDASLNGYGWLNPAIRSIDRFNGIDTYGTGGEVDFIITSYRQKRSPSTETGHIGYTDIDVSAGLASGTITRNEGQALNAGIGGIGGRYPGAVALDRPLLFFNQYKSGDVQTTPALSHPYLITSWMSYGANFIETTPDFIMDTGWLHPDVEANAASEYKENRLWNGPVAVVKDGGGEYHYVGVYETWFSDIEKQGPPFGYNAENDNHILTAHTSDLTAGWTYGWDEGNDPVWIDPSVVTIPRPSVAMNSHGFGCIAGPGHLGWHHPDSGYYYTDLKVTYSVTEDYGLTWSTWDTVSFSALGFPMYHDPAAGDSMLGNWQIIGPDTVWVWYTGPTFMGTNFDMDVVVSEDATNPSIFVGFTSLWGQPTESGWYPSAYYSGIFVTASSDKGATWGAGRISYNNGPFEGDEQIEGRSQFFFDSEVDLAIDEAGNLYASWLDRRKTGVELGVLPRYSEAAETDFKTDIYTARTTENIQTWCDPVNVTDSPSIDEYELNLALHADSRDDGTIWVAYCICADPASGTPGTDSYITLENNVWIGESNDFPEYVSGIKDPKDMTVENYALKQNYPNPFNPRTLIEFTPLKSGQANLTVYSVTGEKVAELYNDYVKKGVNYPVRFDGTNFAAGIYFYRLTIGNSVEVKKMALIK